MSTIKDLPLAARFDVTRNIFFASFTSNIRVDVRTAMELVTARLESTHGREHCLVVDISNVREVTTEAREYMLRLDGGLKNIRAAAFIVSNPVAALIAKVFTKTPKHFPSRVFTSQNDAIAWIGTLKLNQHYGSSSTTS